MKDRSAPLAADRQFFAALTEGDAEALDRILGDDFVLIDVMRGAEVSKHSLLGLVRSGQLTFETVDQAEPHLRLYGATALITGRTQMSGQFGQTSFAVHSRYTHVFVEQQARWRLVAAQGTQIAPE
jgi:ketosteroid isomerase-like protein